MVDYTHNVISALSMLVTATCHERSLLWQEPSDLMDLTVHCVIIICIREGGAFVQILVLSLVDVHCYTVCMAGMLSLTSSLEPRQTIERVAVDSILWSSMDPFPSWDEPPAACEKQEQRKPGKTRFVDSRSEESLEEI